MAIIKEIQNIKGDKVTYWKIVERQIFDGEVYSFIKFYGWTTKARRNRNPKNPDDFKIVKIVKTLPGDLSRNEIYTEVKTEGYIFASATDDI